MGRASWLFSIERLTAKVGLKATLISADGKGIAPHQRSAANSAELACCWASLAAAERSKPYSIVRCCAGTSEIVVPVGTQTLLIGPVKSESIVAGKLDGAIALVAEIAAERAHAAAAAETTPLLGESAVMKALRSEVAMMAASDASIVVLGENGTGKELVARQIHDQSTRATSPYVTVNCSAFNDNLLDSELFGHTRGSFTGAVVDRIGLLETAHGGTFFLDEVGDMSPALQVKLLRVLQEGTFYRVGSNESRLVDVRIIAATNRDLEAMVKRGEFREDLYYRLNVISLRVPPLRERQQDISILANAFLARIVARGGVVKTISPSCLQAMEHYAWPGNVRELENEVERMYVLSGEHREIASHHLSPRLTNVADAPLFLVPEHTKPGISLVDGAGSDEHVQPLSGGGTSPQVGAPLEHSLPKVIETTERHMIKEALIRHRGNKTRAAAELEISRRNLIRLVQKYDLDHLRRM